MPTNVEIKAKLRDRRRVEAIVRHLTTRAPEDIVQEDTFFNVTNGRLKLRVIEGARAELIHYLRNDERRPKCAYRRDGWQARARRTDGLQ